VDFLCLPFNTIIIAASYDTHTSAYVEYKQGLQFTYSVTGAARIRGKAQNTSTHKYSGPSTQFVPEGWS
jgi:hypothetical protein